MTKYLLILVAFILCGQITKAQNPLSFINDGSTHLRVFAKSPSNNFTFTSEDLTSVSKTSDFGYFMSTNKAQGEPGRIYLTLEMPDAAILEGVILPNGNHKTTYVVKTGKFKVHIVFGSSDSNNKLYNFNYLFKGDGEIEITKVERNRTMTGTFTFSKDGNTLYGVIENLQVPTY